jgi:methanethiol oxidase
MTQSTDPTFYRSPGEAMAAPPERLAYVAADDPAGQAKDAMAVLDLDPASAGYGQVVGWSELPTAGNELHHFGWNACSSARCHQGHGHGGQPLERRYLVVPGIRSWRTYVPDTRPTPASPGSWARSPPRSWPPRPATPAPTPSTAAPGGSSCRPWAGPTAARWGGPAGPRQLRGPRGLGARPGEQYFGDDGWWHLDHDTMITSEWATRR